MTGARIDRDAVLAATPLGPLLHRLTGIEPRGAQYPCPSPEHAQTGATPPVSVAVGDRCYEVWRCHGCGAGGTAVDAIVVARGLVAGEALRELAGDPAASAAAPPRAVKAHAKLPEPDPLPTESNMEAWALALQRRPDLLDRMRALKGWTAGACAALDVGWDGKRFTFAHRDAGGRLVGVARYLPNGNPKTLPYGRGHGRDLFPRPELLGDETVLDRDGRRVALRDRYPLHLPEGEPDAVTACALSEPGSPFFGVAIPGANGWQRDGAQRFAGWDVRILVDHDDAGRGLAERLTVDLQPYAREVRVVAWPDVLGHEPPRGFDLGEYAALMQAPTRVAA